MIIDLNSMPFEVFPHFKDGEKEYNAKMWFDGTTRIMHGLLHSGASIGEHAHIGSAEFIFVLKGKGTVIDDGEPAAIEAGQCTYCPEGHKHSLVNTGTEDLEFYACVPKQ